MIRYLVKYTNKSVELFTVSLDQDPCFLELTRINSEQGIVETSVSNTTMPRPDADAFITQALSGGLTEISKSEHDRVLAESKAKLEEQFLEKDGEGFRLVAWNDLYSSMPLKFINNPNEYLPKHLRLFRVYDRHTKWKNDLNIQYDSLGPDAQTGSRNLVFADGLNIDGNFDAGTLCSSLPQFIHIQGDLVAKNLILTGWVDLVVTGNVHVAGVVLGCDGESGGRLKVDGDLTATNVIGGSMFQINVSGKTTAKVHWFSDDEPTLKAESIVPCSIPSTNWSQKKILTPLVDSAYYEDTDWVGGEMVTVYNFNCLFAVETLRKGKLFRE